mmetsp:Transcript_8416/g.21001  ORF Transcript_8416/g.21001 Transcript_8416/m.21001 type:complete len:618 (-) Transcript_8416:786-2639(-)
MFMRLDTLVKRGDAELQDEWPQCSGSSELDSLGSGLCSAFATLNTDPALMSTSPFCTVDPCVVKAFEDKACQHLGSTQPECTGVPHAEVPCREQHEQKTSPCQSDAPGYTLSTCLTAVAPAASGSQQLSAGVACPPHGVKAVCGKRAKMEDAFSVQTNFIDVPLSPVDGVLNKLPARIAVQVGEQLEQIVSPVGSAPLSPGSTTGVPSFSTDAEQQSCSASSSSSHSDSGVCDTLHFFAVYDGHGGIEAAQHCSMRLHHHLSKALDSVAPGGMHQNAVCMADGSGVQCQAEWTLCHHTNDSADSDGQGNCPNICQGPCMCSLEDQLKSASAGSPPEQEPNLFNDNASSGSGGDSSSSSPTSITHLVEDALREAFLRTDEEFAADAGAAMVGSTAVVALVGSKKMWIANCGDSRAVLCRAGKAIQVTDDHKPEREDEAERVEKAGGQVLFWNGHRVMGVLAMSRAIGDHGLRPYVIPEPEITVLSRVGEDDFLLLASDGLWDVMSNQDAINLAMRCLQRAWEKGASRKAAVRIAASVLTKAAVDRGSKDNVTVVIVDLKTPKPVAFDGAMDATEAAAAEQCSACCGALTQQDTLTQPAAADAAPANGIVASMPTLTCS